MSSPTPGFTSEELAQVKRDNYVTDDRVSKALIRGDLSGLSEKEKLDYYMATCKSLGLNPLTKPFAYIRTKQGGEILYARKDCTEQLRKAQYVSLTIVAREMVEGVYVVTARATIPGTAMMGGAYGDRTDESTGAVSIESLKGEDRANAMMKAETKAKRRVTLSICGLGMLDESELESIPNAQPSHDADTGEVIDAPTSKQLTEMHLMRMHGATALPELKQAIEAAKSDEGRIAKGDMAFLRAASREQKEKIVAANKRDTEPAPPDSLKDAAL